MTSANVLVGRIGVSPNGPSFRLGTLRTHLAAAAFVVHTARSAGMDARLLVRIDDTNQARARREFEAPLLDELHGIARIPLGRLGGQGSGPWIVRQSDRLPRYNDVAASLRDAGLALTLADGSTIVRVHRGQLVAAVGPAGDSVRVLRATGWPLWHFASAVDDVDTGVRLAVRGVDKYSAEPVQRAIIHALNGSPPSFHHLPKLMCADGGDRVQELLRSGLRPATLFEYIASSLLRRGSGCASFDELVANVQVCSDLRSVLRLDRRYLAKLDRQVSTRTGPADQISDLAQFAHLRGDSATANYLAVYDVGTLLTAYPRPISVHYELVSSIAREWFSPEMTPPPGTATAVSLLAQSADAARSHLQNTGSSESEAHRTLRWVLCGLSSGPDLRTLWGWHKSNGTLRNRLAAADRTIAALTRDRGTTT